MTMNSIPILTSMVNTRKISKREGAINTLTEAFALLYNERIPPADLQTYQTTAARLRAEVQALTADNSREASKLQKEVEEFKARVQSHIDSLFLAYVLPFP